MKYLLVLLLLACSHLFAAKNIDNEKVRTEKNIQDQISKEKKYAREQTFYSGEKYDLKDAEVNMDSVKNLPDIPNTNEDFDMNDVYD